MKQISPEIYPHSGVHMAWSKFSLALGKIDPTKRRGFVSDLHTSMKFMNLSDFRSSVFRNTHTQITELVYDEED